MPGTNWITVYRKSVYAFPRHDGRWLRFSLNDQPAPPPEPIASVLAVHGSLTFITAWNPMSVELPLSVNECANAQFRNTLAAAGVRYEQSYGSSLPGVAPGWREDGFVLFGLKRQEALEWTCKVQQRAVVWMDSEQVGLLFSDALGFVLSGVVPVDEV